MKPVYTDIWNMAVKYYSNGRYGDLEILPWIITTCEQLCIEEELDDSIIMPLVILHDVGYSKCPLENPAKIEMRLMHMRYGAEIARDILKKVNYDNDKIEKICYFISVHDYWALGKNEIYKKYVELGVFSDLRFLSLIFDVGFEKNRARRGLSVSEMLDLVEHNEKLLNRPFVSSFSRQLFNKLLFEKKSLRL